MKKALIFILLSLFVCPIQGISDYKDTAGNMQPDLYESLYDCSRKCSSGCKKFGCYMEAVACNPVITDTGYDRSHCNDEVICKYHCASLERTIPIAPIKSD